MLINLEKQRGLTLTELLVALIAGLAVTSGVLYIYVSTVNAHTDTIRATRLEEELAATMNLMVRDMRRAGYARIALDRAGQGLAYPDLTPGASSSIASNPFAVMTITDVDGGSDDFDCILYAYDKANAGSTGVASGDNSGFRLKNGAVQKRKTAADCASTSASNWEGLTADWAADITDLDFTDLGPATITINSVDTDVQVRVIRVDLTGQAGSGDDQVSRTLTEMVRVRNDQLCSTTGGCP